MTKRMLIDATHKEELRVAITDGNRLVEYDYESQNRKPLKGSIFLAKVTRVEPSLQAAFVNFGGNRHGFLPFSEIHPDYFRIPVSDREALMAEQEALIKEHDEEEALEDVLEEDPAEDSEEDGAEPIDLDDSENQDEVQEEDQEEPGDNIGNAIADDDLDDVDGNKKDAAKGKKPAKNAKGAKEKASPKADDQKDGKKPSGKDQESEGDKNKKGGRRRGQKGRGRGRGRRSQYRNPNVEIVGGEEIDQEQRFRFNLRRKYKIQEVIKRGQIMLVQANKEERGNKGAAVGSYLSLPGRYCVLMPNSPRAGGVSRKIANHKDRARMRDIVKSLEVPKGMSVIVRTAGVERTKAEIKRDLDYLMRLWDNIREFTLESTAPALVYEEADLIKRSVRDLYTRDVEEILVAGDEGYKTAKEFMKMMIPSHVKKVSKYDDEQLPLFNRYQIESQINEIGQPEVRLKSGGYLVINPTEALISIDVNSGKSTKGRHIEETALKTNLEAADEVARQLKLRDLGGLVVIDFIDMEDRRNNGKVERRMKEALSSDRARVQVGRISSFGLMELSRQRLSPSLTEAQYEKCSVCSGIGIVPTADAMSIMVLRAIEEEGIRARAAQIIVQVTNDVALFILNYKRRKLAEIEQRYDLEVLLRVDDSIPASEYRIEVSRPALQDGEEVGDQESQTSQDQGSEGKDDSEGDRSRKRGRRGGRGRGRSRSNPNEGDKDQGKPQSSDAPKAEEKTEAKDEKPAPKGKSPKKKEESKDADSDSPKPDKKVSTPANDSADDAAPKKKAAPKKEAVKAKKPAEKKDDKPPAKKAVKKEEAASPKKKPAAKAVNDPKPPVAREYEVVNQEPKEKKKGWWNRLNS